MVLTDLALPGLCVWWDAHRRTVSSWEAPRHEKITIHVRLSYISWQATAERRSHCLNATTLHHHCYSRSLPPTSMQHQADAGTYHERCTSDFHFKFERKVKQRLADFPWTWAMTDDVKLLRLSNRESISTSHEGYCGEWLIWLELESKLLYSIVLFTLPSNHINMIGVFKHLCFCSGWLLLLLYFPFGSAQPVI